MADSLHRILALARLTVIDGMKRHAIIGLVCFALAAKAGGLLFFDFIPRDIGRAVNDFIFSVSFLAGFIFLFFHAVQVVARDDQHCAIHIFLARPLSRTEYLLGLFSGLALLLLLLNIILGGSGWFILQLIQTDVGPVLFPRLDPVFFILAIAALYLIELTVLAVIFLFASVIRGSLPVLLLTLAYYFICKGLPVVRESVRQAIEPVADGVDILSLLLRGLSGIFPDFSRLDLKTLVITETTLPPVTELFFVFSVSTLYIILILWFAAFLFKQRDLM